MHSWIPLIAITGQVPQAMIGKGAFQETDFFGMTLPVVKHSFLITDIADIPRVVKEAFHIATTGRPGPVVLIFLKTFSRPRPSRSSLKRCTFGYDPVKKASDLALNEIIGLIEKSERLFCMSAVESSAPKHMRSCVLLLSLQEFP